MPKITSFQGGFANDKNAGPEGAFWNISGLEYRKNVAYLELAKGISDQYTVSGSNGTPIALTTWGNIGFSGRDIVAITNTGKVINYTGVQSTTPSGSATNVFERGGVRYILGTSKIHRLSTGSLSSYDADIVIGGGTTFSVSTDFRPVLSFNGDIIIGNGTSVARFNVDGTVIEWTPGTTQPVIGGLNGTVYAITQIGPNIYVWCNNGSNTNLYIWDGLSNSPNQTITYTDKPISNVALLGNQHYWWSKKSDYSIRTVNIGESYKPQEFIKTTFPRVPLTTSHDDNRMTIHVNNSAHINAIETLNDTVFLPGVGCIYSFGQYQPGVGSYSLGREIAFTGTYVTAMVSGGTTTGGRDFGGMLGFSYKLPTDGHSIAVYNAGQYGETPGVFYRLSGFYESMEFIATDMAKGENDKKITVPCQIPHSSCSIKVYEKRDGGSYNLIRTITNSDFTGFGIVEIPSQGVWRTKQLKFELITTNSDYSPRLYIGIDNQTQPVGKV